MEKLENLFKQSFNDIKKLIRFKPMWLGGDSDFRRVVVDREHRLMLDVGETSKFEDKHNSRYIAIGTPFGIIVARSATLFGKTIVKYETTNELVKAFSNTVEERFNFITAPSGLLGEYGFTYMTSPQFLEDLKVIAEMMTQSGHVVCDGILGPRPTKPKEQTNKDIWDAAAKRRKMKAKPRNDHLAEKLKKDIVNAAPQSYEPGTTATVILPRQQVDTGGLVDVDVVFTGETVIGPGVVEFAQKVLDGINANKEKCFVNPTPRHYELGVKDGQQSRPFFLTDSTPLSMELGTKDNSKPEPYVKVQPA